jgi:hypothetical protein
MAFHNDLSTILLTMFLSSTYFFFIECKKLQWTSMFCFFHSYLIYSKYYSLMDLLVFLTKEERR